MTRSPRVSVVVVSHNEGANLRSTVDNLLATLPAYSELVVVDDCSTDGSVDAIRAYPDVRVLRTPERLGSSQSRNFGAFASQGDALVFSDAHVETEPGWVPELTRVLEDPHVGLAGPAVAALGAPEFKGYGMTCAPNRDVRGDDLLVPRWLYLRSNTPYAVPMLCGCFVAMRRDAFESCGGFDSGIRQWGSEDTELSIRLWLLGYECVLVPDVEVAHLFKERHGYHVDYVSVLHNMLRMATVHFGDERLVELYETVANDPALAAADELLQTTDVYERRDQLRALRRYDDDWYFGGVCARANGLAA